ncbi:conserved Plasmodium protein, unknown function [Plasmodium malariae]|uniref:Uncharacterized protein n=1 Tax=Plasmodium malariae TaxID=5858 RepID=A0A1D3PCH0_PLAMA|nr:conserved Plasmodium protein, unknown function [Plasmodium malariae]SCN12973.1 conserved Plasmodium protein, unknown function [Plasmodium malariae]
MNPLLEYKRIKQAVFNKPMLNIKREILENDNSKLKNKENNHSVWNKITQNKINKEIQASSNKTVQKDYFNKNIKNVSSESNQNVISENSSEHNEAIIKEYESTEDENVKLSLICHSNVEKNATGLVKYEYCYICEMAKPCSCVEEHFQYEQDISTWNYGKIKSNIHSNFRDISNIMDKIQSSKKKLEDTKNNIEKNVLKKGVCGKNKNNKKEYSKNLNPYEKFYHEIVKVIKRKLDNFRNGRTVVEDELGREAERKIAFNDEDGEHIMKKRLEALCDIEKKHLQLLQDLFEEYKDMEERML